MQTLLLLMIAGSFAAGGVLAPLPLVAQAPSPATKPAATGKAATGKSASATHPAGGAASRATSKATQSKAAQSKAAQSKSAQSTATHGTGKLAATSTAPKAGGKAASSAVPDSADGSIAGSLAPTGTISLRSAPDGPAIASIGPQSPLVPVARDRGWVRVRTEGWVRETEVAATDPSQVTISAADLRADPDGVRGKTVRWDVEVLAFATADPLRKGLNPYEPYLLARGPGSESALLYVAVPPSLLALARTLASRAPVSVSIVATVRSGRSEPVGVPILDAQSLVKR
jgi:hypothetical protein